MPNLSHDRSSNAIRAEHPKLGTFALTLEGAPALLFTENETNTERLYGWRGNNTSIRMPSTNI